DHRNRRLRSQAPHQRVSHQRAVPALAGAIEAFGESFDYPVSQQRAIGDKSRILFDNLKGNIRVNGGDVAEIRITGRRTIRAYNKADADHANEQSSLEVARCPQPPREAQWRTAPV